MKLVLVVPTPGSTHPILAELLVLRPFPGLLQPFAGAFAHSSPILRVVVGFAVPSVVGRMSGSLAAHLFGACSPRWIVLQCCPYPFGLLLPLLPEDHFYRSGRTIPPVGPRAVLHSTIPHTVRAS